MKESPEESKEPKGITFRTVREVLHFLDSFDGYGMISTDEGMQVDRIRELAGGDLLDDYEEEEDEEAIDSAWMF